MLEEKKKEVEADWRWPSEKAKLWNDGSGITGVVSDCFGGLISMLKFEGVYMNAFVYVNGQIAAKSPFGYTTFYAPLNDFLKIGEDNEIRVQVRAGAMTNSRWYSGTGIYRPVWLYTVPKKHLRFDSVKVTTLDYIEPRIRVEVWPNEAGEVKIEILERKSKSGCF